MPIVLELRLRFAAFYNTLISRSIESIKTMFLVLEQVPNIEHPLDARVMAIARPMPREAPVMMATFPSRSCSRSPIETMVRAGTRWLRLLWRDKQTTKCGQVKLKILQS